MPKEWGKAQSVDKPHPVGFRGTSHPKQKKQLGRVQWLAWVGEARPEPAQEDVLVWSAHQHLAGTQSSS